MKAIALFFISLVLLLSCAGGAEKAEATFADHTPSNNPLASTTLPDIYADGISNQIKKAHYRFETKNVKATLDAIELAVKKYPSYISSSSLTLNNPMLESRLSIKVQNQYFDDLLKDIDKEAVFVNFRNITTEDVSKEFVDLESRLKSKREVEARLMSILRNKAGTVKDVLEAEKQIGDLHEEIESVISRINFLKDQVKYSTIDLEVYQTISEVIATNEESFITRIKNGMKTGLDGVKTILVAVVYIWPILILILGAWIWLKKTKGLHLRSTVLPKS